MKQEELPIGHGRSLPIHDIITLILDRGRLTKNDIRLMWSLSEEEYALLKSHLEDEKVIEPGSRGAGGFVAKFAKRPNQKPDAEIVAPSFKSEHERKAAERLAELLSHPELEELLGDLVYTIRRARLRLTGEDRRGSKSELAAALLTKHGIDLFCYPDVRALIAKRAKAKYPNRWHAGKSTAIKFVEAAGFPIEYAGIPAEEPPDDFEYLEGRVDLHALQDFQVEVQKKLLSVLETRAGRAIVTLPTGGGKTRVAVDTIRDWLTARYRQTSTGTGNVVLWLAHTEELCEQATLCFREVWQGSSNVCPMLLFRFWGGYTRDLEQHGETLLTMHQRPAILVSTPQRLINLIEGKIASSEPILAALMSLVGMIVIDEAHRAAAPIYRKLIAHFSASEQAPAVVGLTATPFRSEYSPDDPTRGTLELKDLFKTIIEPIEVLGEDPRKTLQEREYLARPIFDVIKTETRLKTPEGVNVDNPSDEDIEKIDYALKLRADKPERRLEALGRIIELCRDSASSVIYFGPTVQDAECMAFLLRQQGIEAAFVSGDTRDVSRRKIIGEFKAGRVQVLCNCEVLTTGFDAPKVTHVIMARPTVSQVLYEQMVGRGLRGPRFGGTATCHIVDLEDNYRSERPELGYKRFREIWAPTSSK
jgi:superfamily II DNA or RNA helicase